MIISEVSLSALFYLSFDIYKIQNAKSKLSDLVSVCEVANAGKDTVLLSLDSAFKDKEDALQYYIALRAKADYFITRNKSDYKHAIASLPVYTPIEFIRLIE